MALKELTAAIQRVQAAFARRPEVAVGDDTAATARWEGGTRMRTRHPGGGEYQTDMPAVFGGSDDAVTPGWLFRAGLASCAATSVVLRAAARGIELSRLEVVAHSRSDSRGLLGMMDGGGSPVPAAALQIGLSVRIAAPSVPAEILRRIVQEGVACSPVPASVRESMPLSLEVEIEAG